MVNAILGVSACAAASGRRIIFSSFDPDVCVALRLRQQRIPVCRFCDVVRCDRFLRDLWQVANG